MKFVTFFKYQIFRREREYKLSLHYEIYLLPSSIIKYVILYGHFAYISTLQEGGTATVRHEKLSDHSALSIHNEKLDDCSEQITNNFKIQNYISNSLFIERIWQFLCAVHFVWKRELGDRLFLSQRVAIFWCKPNSETSSDKKTEYTACKNRY